jgi:hypothetical protein
VLLHPRDSVAQLLSAAGLECPIVPDDCAWSYEYEAIVGTSLKFKLADIVVHARDADGQEVLIVVDAKRPGERLNETGDVPDTRPGERQS